MLKYIAVAFAFACIPLLYFVLASRETKRARKRHAQLLREVTRDKLAKAHKLNIETPWKD